MSSKETEEIQKDIIVECPHCKDFIIIEKLNCCIFRHGIFKNTLKQIEPHAPKEVCDYLSKEKLIIGCGKPFKIIQKDNSFFTEICDYI
jgi:DNA-directed RNA polymerase subunit RPC12/RpoP